MRKVVFLLLFVFAGLTGLYGQNIKLKADVKISYPIDMGEEQEDYFSINPAFDIRLEIPVHKSLGLIASGEFNFGNFSTKKIGGTKVGKYQVYSILAGAFYSINLNNDFSLIPSVQAGVSEYVMNTNSRYFKEYQSKFSILGSVELEKKLEEHFALNAVISFGYYQFYCPLSLGFGAVIIF